jgi:hypothetical protein
MSASFEAMYAEGGRPSVAPERLLKASLLIALYSVRSDRLFCEMLASRCLFRHDTTPPNGVPPPSMTVCIEPLHTCAVIFVLSDLARLRGEEDMPWTKRRATSALASDCIQDPEYVNRRSRKKEGPKCHGGSCGFAVVAQLAAPEEQLGRYSEVPRRNVERLRQKDRAHEGTVNWFYRSRPTGL